MTKLTFTKQIFFLLLYFYERTLIENLLFTSLYIIYFALHVVKRNRNTQLNTQYTNIKTTTCTKN